jgi:hypothetical protein
MAGILPAALVLRVALLPGATDLPIAASVDCPEAAAIAAALKVHGVAAPGPGWRAVVEPAGDDPVPPGPGPSLRLRLLRPDGSAAVDRALPGPGRDCGAAADAIALILERQLRDLAWSTPVQPDGNGDAPRAAAALRGSTPPAARPPARGPALTLLAGPSWSSGDAGALAPAIELRAQLLGPLHLGLGALPLGTTADQPLPGGGRARLRAWPLVARALAQRATGRWRPLAALDVGLRLERGESTGIAQPAARWRRVLTAGAALGLAWAPHPRWRVAAEAGLSRLVRARDFEVAGHGPVLAPARWQAQLGLRLGCVLWP